MSLENLPLKIAYGTIILKSLKIQKKALLTDAGSRSAHWINRPSPRNMETSAATANTVCCDNDLKKLLC
jgi:hypothetical protein